MSDKRSASLPAACTATVSREVNHARWPTKMDVLEKSRNSGL